MTHEKADAYNDHFLSVCPSERFSPSDLTRVTLHLEIFMTFRRAKSKAFCVIPDEHCAVAWIDVDGAEVALFDTHDG